MNAVLEETHFQLPALDNCVLLFEDQNTDIHVAIAAIFEAQPQHNGERRASVGS
jgi:hypothetical protein